MFNVKNIKLFIIVAVLALPLAACGQRANLEKVEGAVEDSTSY